MAALAQVIPIQQGAPSGALYEIVDYLDALFTQYDEAEPEDRIVLEQEMERYLDAEVAKVDNIDGYIRFCESQAQLAAAEAKRQAERKARFEARAERIENYVLCTMESRGRERLNGSTVSFSLAKCPPSVCVTDQAKLPAEFIRETVTITTAPDKPAIARALKAREIVPGAYLVSDKKRLVRK